MQPTRFVPDSAASVGVMASLYCREYIDHVLQQQPVTGVSVCRSYVDHTDRRTHATHLAHMLPSILDCNAPLQRNVA